MEFKLNWNNIFLKLNVIALLLVAYFLGYIAAHLTNQQIERYCFEYRMYEAYNRGYYYYIENLNNFSYPHIYVNISVKKD